MATIIKANGTVSEITPKNGTDFSLKELRDVVKGYIEIVNLPDGRIMVVNEEGKLYGLPINQQATNLYGYEIIVGDVLVCKRNEVK